MPGQKGNSFIYGHSSDYAYKQGMYNTIFRTLPQVDAGEEVWAYVRQADGSYKRFVYRVSQSYKTDKYDTGTLLPGNGKSMTLSTCVPIGSDAERWIVRAELVGGETTGVDMSYGLDFSIRQQIDRALADITRTQGVEYFYDLTNRLISIREKVVATSGNSYVLGLIDYILDSLSMLFVAM